eukprot:3140035-Rhodomonas_salina.2
MLRDCYATSGTDEAYGATRQRQRVRAGSELRYERAVQCPCMMLSAYDRAMANQPAAVLWVVRY